MPLITRREALQLSAAAAAQAVWAPSRSSDLPPDHRLEIAPYLLELSPRVRLRTVAYNGQVPGPLLRLREGKPVTIDVTNHTARPEVVHWHGLFLPPQIDGAMEEGTPPIAPGDTTRISLSPEPSGFRWYHTHTSAEGDLRRAQYGGQHGPLLIEPRDDPGHYDQEFFITLHDWGGYLSGSEDGAMNPAYRYSSINGKLLGAGEPLRVQQGQRVLLHVLNSSPTEVHWVALAGHQLQVLALDGNPVPSPNRVPMLRVAPAERVSALVEMDNPGIWIFGEVRKHVQAAGMGIVFEYAGRNGVAQWQQPRELLWRYERFAATSPNPRSMQAGTVQPIPLTFRSQFRGHGAMEGWLINGLSFPRSAIAPLVSGQRYRLQLINDSADDHPLHLHRHRFELRSLNLPLAASGAAAPELAGVWKDVLLVDAHSRSEVEFVADHPGDTLFHCHQQDHMDMGFMLLMHYA